MFNKFMLSTFFIIGMLSLVIPLAAEDRALRGRGGEGMGQPHEMQSENRFDTGSSGHSNQIYSGDQYRHGAPVTPDRYAAPVAPMYGYGSYGSVPPSGNAFPDQTEADVLYMREVQQMRQGG